MKEVSREEWLFFLDNHSGNKKTIYKNEIYNAENKLIAIAKTADFGVANPHYDYYITEDKDVDNEKKHEG